MAFEDETGFSQHPRVSRVWARRGQPFRVPTTSNHRRRLNVFGWVAPLEGRHGLMRAPRGDTQGFLALLGRLRQRWRGKVLHLFVDGARWHRGPRVEQYLAAHREIRLEYLPPYQPGQALQAEAPPPLQDGGPAQAQAGRDLPGAESLGGQLNDLNPRQHSFLSLPGPAPTLQLLALGFGQVNGQGMSWHVVPCRHAIIGTLIYAAKY